MVHEKKKKQLLMINKTLTKNAINKAKIVSLLLNLISIFNVDRNQIPSVDCTNAEKLTTLHQSFHGYSSKVRDVPRFSFCLVHALNSINTLKSPITLLIFLTSNFCPFNNEDKSIGESRVFVNFHSEQESLSKQTN